MYRKKVGEVKAMMDLYDVIRKALNTEKSVFLSALSKYTFVVHKDAKKNVIKKSVEQIFDKKVLKVNVINMKGKNRVFKGIRGNTTSYKKVVVTLSPGDTLEFAV